MITISDLIHTKSDADSVIREKLAEHGPRRAQRVTRCDDHRYWMNDLTADCPDPCENCTYQPYEMCGCGRDYPCPVVLRQADALGLDERVVALLYAEDQAAGQPATDAHEEAER